MLDAIYRNQAEMFQTGDDDDKRLSSARSPPGNCARPKDAVLTAVALFTALLGLFDAAGFLAEAAFASLFAAPRL